jgi:hypothetical protein
MNISTFVFKDLFVHFLVESSKVSVIPVIPYHMFMVID